MERADVIKVLSSLKAAYPNAYRSMTRQEGDALVDTWCLEFGGDDAKSVADAVREYISSDKSGFPPSIGAIRDRTPKSRKCGSVPEEWKRLLDRYRDLTARRRGHGIPHDLEAARRSGLSATQWDKMLTDCGLDVEVDLR